MKDDSEPIFIIGLLFFIVGIVLSFIAMAKPEEGTLKYISLIYFFIVLFCIT